MKYQNGNLMRDLVTRLSARQQTRGEQQAKPYGETDYIRDLKNRVANYMMEGTIVEQH